MKTLSRHVKDFALASSIFTAILLAALPFKLHAQDRIGNGGEGTEVELVTQRIQLEGTAGKIFRFFMEHPELQEEFSEFRIEDLLELQGQVEFEVDNEVKIDREGVIRTCLNYPEEKKISCNYSRLEGLSPTVYFVLTLHELLGILNVEIASIENDQLIESYPISSRLGRYVSRVQNHDLVFTPEIEHAWSNRDDTHSEKKLQTPSCVIKNLILNVGAGQSEDSISSHLATVVSKLKGKGYIISNNTIEERVRESFAFNSLVDPSLEHGLKIEIGFNSMGAQYDGEPGWLDCLFVGSKSFTRIHYTSNAGDTLLHQQSHSMFPFVHNTCSRRKLRRYYRRAYRKELRKIPSCHSGLGVHATL